MGALLLPGPPQVGAENAVSHHLPPCPGGPVLGAMFGIAAPRSCPATPDPPRSVPNTESSGGTSPQARSPDGLPVGGPPEFRGPPGIRGRALPRWTPPPRPPNTSPETP